MPLNNNQKKYLRFPFIYKIYIFFFFLKKKKIKQKKINLTKLTKQKNI